jgi:hypothetical protein
MAIIVSTIKVGQKPAKEERKQMRADIIANTASSRVCKRLFQN